MTVKRVRAYFSPLGFLVLRVRFQRREPRAYRAISNLEPK